MKPYYEEQGITVYHGDCREILPQLPKVDLVLTDPPYGISLNTDSRRFSGGRRGHIGKNGNGIGTANGAPIVNDSEPFNPFFLTQYGEHQIIWGWNNYPNLLPRGACLVWLKRYDEAFGSFLSDAETAWMSKGHGVYCRRDLSNNAITNDRVHPTQKPITLMEWCLSLFPKEGRILDPFMGSGTTLVAAKRLGWRAIGIEIEEKYCEIAVRRIQEASMPLFDNPEPQPQESLFAALDRCDREIAELDALPADVNAKAVDIVMARFDWMKEKSLIQRQIEEQA